MHKSYTNHKIVTIQLTWRKMKGIFNFDKQLFISSKKSFFPTSVLEWEFLSDCAIS